MLLIFKGEINSEAEEGGSRVQNQLGSYKQTLSLKIKKEEGRGGGEGGSELN